MLLMPPVATACPVCAVQHPPHFPHDASSVYYQQRFYMLRGVWPTWADALAHCDEATREHWEQGLRDSNAWSEPTDREPIADPPAESFHQVIDDQSSPVTVKKER